MGRALAMYTAKGYTKTYHASVKWLLKLTWHDII